MNKNLVSRRNLVTGSMGALIGGFACASALASCTNNNKTTKTGTTIPLNYADCLYIGNVTTVDDNKPTAQAITVKDNIITYVGDLETAKSLCDNNTKIIEYKDKFIYPGFMDYHTHPSYAGMLFTFLCNLYGGHSKEEYLGTLKTFVQGRPDDKFYAGMGWVHEGFKPLAKDLDSICEDKMIMLMSFDLHSIWLNSKTMEELNIDKEYAKKYDPSVCEIDEDGNPTGCLNDNAAIEFFDSLVNSGTIITEDIILEGMYEWQKRCFKWGFTAVDDASLEERDVAIYNKLVNDKEWKLRTFASYYIDENTPDKKSKVEQCYKLASEYNNDYFQIIWLKFFLDGIVDLKTAWFTEDYVNDASNKGVPRMCDYDELLKWVVDASEHNMNVQLHSIGDGATKFAVEVFKQAAIKTHNFDQRNAIAHLQIVRKDNVKTIADINAIAPVPFFMNW